MISRLRRARPRGRFTRDATAAAAAWSVVLLTLAAGCTPNPSSAADSSRTDAAASPVRVAAGEPLNFAPAVEAPGILGPLDQASLSFSLPGVVLRLTVDAGDPVQDGELLATLDLREADARVRQAQERVNLAERNHDRLQRLLVDRVVPRVQVEDAGSDLEVARAALAEARVAREFAEIRAPAAGTVLWRHVEVGERVTPGEVVLVVGRGGSQRVEAHLSDRDRLQVALGDPAEFHLPALAGSPIPGRVTRLAGASDPRSGGFPVEVTLDAPLDLPVGVVGRLRIAPAAGRTALRIPAGALLDGDGQEGRLLVFEPDGETVELRRVMLGGIDADGVLVIGGLAPGEQVVVEGGAWVTPGDRVQVVR